MRCKPILSLDFDGVIHSYASGWQGPRTITDPPVPGALEFIVRALDAFDVQVFSSRSRYLGGRCAMKHWLRRHYRAYVSEDATDWESAPDWWQREIMKYAFADPVRVEVDAGIGRLLRRIGFPRSKPPAMVAIDDRALTFTGQWPDIGDLMAFAPWYRQAVAADG